MADEMPNVAEEIAAEEVVPPQDQEQNSPDPKEKSEAPPQNESDKEYNFRQMREKQRLLEEERDFYKRQTEQLTPKAHEDAGPNSVGEDDLLEGRHYNKLQKEIHRLGEELKRREMEAIPDRLKGRFSDFNSVVTKENLEKLKDSEPELYTSITSGDNLFSKGVAAYKALKGLGYIKSKEDFSKEKEAVEANQKKPMSAQAVKGGALHEANSFAQGLTPDLRKKLQQEMADAIKAH